MKQTIQKDTFWEGAISLLLLLFSACATAPSLKTRTDLDHAQELHGEGKKLFQSGKPVEALALLDQSLATCEEYAHKACIAENLNAMGLIYLALEEKEKALAALKRALPINQEINNGFAVAAVLNSLGKIENDRGRDAEALRYFNESLTVSLRLHYPVGLGTTLNNIGKIYYARREYTQALHYYNRALYFFVAGEDRERARVVMGNIRMAEDRLKENAHGEASPETTTTPKETGRVEIPPPLPVLSAMPPEEEKTSSIKDFPKKDAPLSSGPEMAEEKKRGVLLGPEEKNTAPQEEIPGEIIIRKDLLNLYESPSLQAPIIGKVLKGGIYPVLDYSPSFETDPEDVFFKIRLKNGKTGWVYGSENR